MHDKQVLFNHYVDNKRVLLCIFKDGKSNLKLKIRMTLNCSLTLELKSFQNIDSALMTKERGIRRNKKFKKAAC